MLGPMIDPQGIDRGGDAPRARTRGSDGLFLICFLRARAASVGNPFGAELADGNGLRHCRRLKDIRARCNY